MNVIKILIVISILYCSISYSHSKTSDTTSLEIQHLLLYIKNSGCKLERNGKKYGGTKSYKHIQKKYEHYKNKINTAEEFIELCATRSLLSGREYKVYCSEYSMPVNADYWLLEELRNYRVNQ